MLRKFSNIKITNKVQISAQHSMIVLELADGRKLQVTAEHPSSTEKKSLDQYAVGEELNGSKIITKTIVTYTEEYTYDILPDSETGTYWANGILIGSTLTTFSRIIQ